LLEQKGGHKGVHPPAQGNGDGFFH
jgi:hypothetical protein